jgi:hypothetical protein
MPTATMASARAPSTYVATAPKPVGPPTLASDTSAAAHIQAVANALALVPASIAARARPRARCFGEMYDSATRPDSKS